MSSLITLYDIPMNVPNKPFSPNTWKVRFCLNYKGLPHQTVWVEFPDIESVCKQIGAEPTSTKEDGSPHYTVPVIHDPATNTIVSDSARIAEYLDDTYPTAPNLFPRGTRALQYVFIAFMKTMAPVPDAARHASYSHLNPASQAHFLKKGYKPKDEQFPADEKRDGDLKVLKEKLDVVHGWFGKEEGGYVMGDQICYADIALVSYLLWIKIVMEDSKEWREIASWHEGRWKALVDSVEKYTVVL